MLKTNQHKLLFPDFRPNPQVPYAVLKDSIEYVKKELSDLVESQMQMGKSAITAIRKETEVCFHGVRMWEEFTLTEKVRLSTLFRVISS